MKGWKKRTSVDPPLPERTAADGGGGGGEGGAKCVENDQNPPRLPPCPDAPAEDDRQKQLEKGGAPAAAEKKGASTAAVEEEDEEKGEEEGEEGKKGNEKFDEELQMEEGEGEEGEGEGEGEEGEAEGEKAVLAEGFYEIEAVRRKRLRKGQPQYLIKWRGWPETSNTWEPLENFLSCSDVIEAFEESLRSGKRSARRRKRKCGTAQSQTKKKQQQRSPAAATYNVPAVKVRILENPLTSPSPDNPNGTNVEASVGGVKNVETDEKANEDDVDAVTYRTEPLEELNDLNIKISELKGASVRNVDSVDKSRIDPQEALLPELVGGLVNVLQKADCPGPVQSDRCIGAKRRKSSSVKRFKQESPAGMVENIQNVAAANRSSGIIGNLGSQTTDLVVYDFRLKNKIESSRSICDITEIVKPMSYSASALNSGQDMVITFMAKRSDGSEVTVDNRFLKANHPILLINYYEKHLKYANPALS